MQVLENNKKQNKRLISWFPVGCRDVNKGKQIVNAKILLDCQQIYIWWASVSDIWNAQDISHLKLIVDRNFT